MARSYDIIDADGHVLEPVDIWDKYIDPSFRERAPRLVIDTDGKERLLVEDKILGSTKGMGVTDGGVVNTLSGNMAKPMKKNTMRPSTGPPIQAHRFSAGAPHMTSA